MPTVFSEPSSPIVDLTPGNIRIPSKMCTPLAGRWADIEDTNTAARLEQRHRSLQVAMVQCGTLTLDDDDDDETISDVAEYVAESTVVEDVQDNQDYKHLCHVRRYDPYTFNSYIEEYHCACQDCMLNSNQQSSNNMLVNDVMNAEGFEVIEQDIENPAEQCVVEEPLEYQPPFSNMDYEAQYTTYQPYYQVPAAYNNVGSGLMHFVPPPPPPRTATCSALVESGEGDVSEELAQQMQYNIAMRWYDRVEQCQMKWVPSSDPCPVPNTGEYSFMEWCTDVTKWWLRHFEHAQKKWTMGMLPLKNRDELTTTTGKRRSEGFIMHTDVRPRGAPSPKPAASLWSHRQAPSDSSSSSTQAPLPAL